MTIGVSPETYILRVYWLVMYRQDLSPSVLLGYQMNQCNNLSVCVSRRCRKKQLGLVNSMWVRADTLH